MQSPYYNRNTGSVLISKSKNVTPPPSNTANLYLLTGKKYQREPYHKTSPATICQKDAAAGDSLEKKKQEGF